MRAIIKYREDPEVKAMTERIWGKEVSKGEKWGKPKLPVVH